MTRDEILNMPAGREMDVLIAEKVIGCSVKRDYSTDIAAAILVLNALPPPYTWNILTDGWGEKRRYCVEIWGAEAAFADAEILPLAACRAVLLAVMP